MVTRSRRGRHSTRLDSWRRPGYDACSTASNHSMDQGSQGIAATDALQSTFVVACLAPSAVSIGL